MRKKPTIALLLTSLLLSGCSFDIFGNGDKTIDHDDTSDSSHGNDDSSGETTDDSKDTSSDSGENSSSGNSEESQDSSDDESSDSGSSSSSGDLGTVTIQEARELCKQYVSGYTNKNIVVNNEYTVTIKGLAVSRFDLVKTNAKYGYDVSYSGKVVLGDSTGYIATASNNVSGSGSIYMAVADYMGKDTSKYTVTGKLSMCLGQPEIKVEGSDDKFDSSLDVNFDALSQYDEVISVDRFYEYAKATNYNVAGHGYAGLYRMNDLLCVQRDYGGTVYTFTDGNSLFKAMPYKANEFTVGNKYDLSGMLTLKDYSPALKVIAHKPSTSSIGEVYKDASPITIANLRKIKTSQDDTETRFPEYIGCFSKMYKATVYVSHYVVNGKYYVTLSDTLYSGSELTNQNTAQIDKAMVTIENHSYWNLSAYEYTNENWNRLYPYERSGESLDVYFMPWGVSYASKQVKWKVNMFEEFLPSPIE